MPLTGSRPPVQSGFANRKVEIPDDRNLKDRFYSIVYGMATCVDQDRRENQRSARFRKRQTFGKWLASRALRRLAPRQFVDRIPTTAQTSRIFFFVSWPLPVFTIQANRSA